MSYLGQTTFYEIPYITNGDFLSESNEKEQLERIDNLLFLNNCFYPNCIVLEGKYSLKSDEENQNKTLLTIEPKNDISFMVVIRNKLYFSKEKISLDLLNGEKYYIYVNAQYDNNKNIYTIDVSPKIATYDAVLLCEVDLTFDNRKININHQEKVYINNIKKHVIESVNPHGKILKQETIETNKILISGEPIYQTIYKTVDIIKNSAIVNVPNAVFVNVMPVENIGNFYVKLSKNNFVIFSEKNGKCKLEIKVEKNGN